MPQVLKQQRPTIETACRFIFVLLCLGLFGCADSGDSDSEQVVTFAVPDVVPPANPYRGYVSAQYDAATNWLCRPDIEGDDNVCAGDLSATIVFSDGSTQLEPFVDVEDQAVDCFYVYPTVSLDLTVNADLEPGREIGTTYVQAARYRSVCKMYAPMHRQVSLIGLALGLTGGDVDAQAAFDLAYGDVVDAFMQFVANGQGRGFILIGHSQGTAHLVRLIQEEIETQPYLAQRMVAAHLLGLVVELPNDGDVGATFQSTRPCNFDSEIGCFVNYSSFRETNPPRVEDGFFGITQSEDTRAACTHPVDLGSGRLDLDSYFSATQLTPYNDADLNASITTPFTKLPGLIQGECIEQDGLGYLAITVNGDPDDPRVDDVGNDGLPGWGLHNIDVGLAHGDLVRLAQRQSDEWQRQQ